MNHETQTITDEINKRFDELKTHSNDKLNALDEKILEKMGEHDDAWERKFVDLKISHDARMGALEHTTSAFVIHSFDDWSTNMEGTWTTSASESASSPSIGNERFVFSLLRFSLCAQPGEWRRPCFRRAATMCIILKKNQDYIFLQN
jgi:hypothetical protein